MLAPELLEVGGGITLGETRSDGGAGVKLLLGEEGLGAGLEEEGLGS